MFILFHEGYFLVVEEDIGPPSQYDPIFNNVWGFDDY